MIVYPQDKKYTSKEICELLNINHCTLSTWLAMGYVQATISQHGSGVKNIYNYHDFIRIKRFKEFLKLGCTRKLAKFLTNQWIPKTAIFNEFDIGGYKIKITDKELMQNIYYDKNTDIKNERTNNI